MKPILSITETKFTAVPIVISRREQMIMGSVINWARILCQYNMDWGGNGGVVAGSSLYFNLNYVDALFGAILYLHQYYEFSQCHFKLKKVSNYKNYDEWVADVLRQEKNGADEYIKLAFEEYSKDSDEKTLLIMLRQATKAKMGLR